MNTDKNKTEKPKTRLRYNWTEIWANAGVVLVVIGFMTWFIMVMSG